MRILVCGDRKWTDTNLVITSIARTILGDEWKTLMLEYDDWNHHKIIEGAAKGADMCGKEAALFLGIGLEEYPADWDKYGRKAGPIRNRWMYEEGKPDVVLAFHDSIESSKGTNHMIQVAKKGGTPVHLISHNSVLD